MAMKPTAPKDDVVCDFCLGAPLAQEVVDEYGPGVCPRYGRDWLGPSEEARKAQAALGWRWPVQQAIYHDLILGDNEWTTWSDACAVAEHVATVLEEQGYRVVDGALLDELIAVSEQLSREPS